MENNNPDPKIGTLHWVLLPNEQGWFQEEILDSTGFVD